MSTYVKYIMVSRDFREGSWLLPLMTVFSRLNHAIADLLTCALSFRRGLRPVGCNFIKEKPTMLDQLDMLGRSFQWEYSSIQRYIASQAALTRRSVLDHTSVHELVAVTCNSMLGWLRRLGDAYAEEGILWLHNLEGLFGDASRDLAYTSVVSGYRLHAQAWFAEARFGSAWILNATFHADLGFTRMQVLSSLIRALEETASTTPTANISCSNCSRPVKMAELGVCRAATSEHLLQQHPRLEWLGIDTYEGEWAKELPVAHAALAPFLSEPRAKLWNVRSEVVTDEEVARSSLDFLFVDGDHSEKQVLLDLGHWMPRVRSGGIVAGHDYYDQNYIGVTRAVHRLLPEDTLLHVAPDHVFFWYVP